MREVWRELMFADEEQVAKPIRDPMAPARRSDAAVTKVQSHMLDDGTPVHSFQTLMVTFRGLFATRVARQAVARKHPLSR